MNLQVSWRLSRNEKQKSFAAAKELLIFLRRIQIDKKCLTK